MNPALRMTKFSYQVQLQSFYKIEAKAYVRRDMYVQSTIVQSMFKHVASEYAPLV